MYAGAIPDELLGQMLRSVDFASWTSARIFGSGLFRIERGIRTVAPLIDLHSADESLVSRAIGGLATSAPLAYRFTGALEWLEAVGDDPLDRAAALLIGMDVAPFLSGSATPYKTRHLDHYRSRLPAIVLEAAGRMAELLRQLSIESFAPRTMLEQLADARADGAGLVGVVPIGPDPNVTAFKFLVANVEHDAQPRAAVDPASLPELIDSLGAAGVPYALLVPKLVDGREPIAEMRRGRKPAIYLYANAGRPSFRRTGEPRSKPFPYRQLDLAQIGAESHVDLVLCETAQAAFVKDVYLAKHIQHANGEVNVLAYVDGMLAGLIVFARATRQVYHGNEIHLLSDLSVTRAGKVSKLIARLATSAEIIRFLERHYLRRFEYVVTTAFAKAPVSMKYRGVFDLLKRTATDDGFSLNYGRQVQGEDAASVYRWWWDKYGKAGGEGEG